ncbi:uncharacterized protein LOC113502097 [Trichoplusia ni]|uniref:Uncharacterized protein LOC113502097 n=1 Tax=Trichoplusia ni TaxID=7111 RepID=A0A7E5WF10_TRINI|nr:uncharacterized protein LOC113502097 [Trichoplusia ni]
MTCFFSNKYLNILHQNIAGLLKKSDVLAVCLDDLFEKQINVDIICITEHFVMKGYENQLNVPNYCLAACYSRKEKKRGGACILVKNGHRFKELPKIANISSPGVFECCGIELIDYKIIVICIYRVPNINNLNDCLAKLEFILKDVSNARQKKIVIAGDFNIDMLKSTRQSISFECLLLNFNFKLALKQPTRLSSLTCIDNFAHNYKKACRANVLDFAMSDHTAQLLQCPVPKVFTNKFWYSTRRDYANENIIKFKDCMNSLTFSEIYETHDPNIAYNKFIDTFKMFYDLCFPFYTIKINIIKKPKWLSRGVKLCSKKKRLLLWQLRLNPNQVNKVTFSNYSKLYKKIIKLTQKSQNNYNIKQSKNKSKTTWQIINQTKLNIPKNPINSINLGSFKISDPLDICNAFNNHFVDKIQPKIDVGSNPKPHRISTQPNSIFLAPSEPYNIFKIIMSLKNTNSVGYDGISTKVLKSVANDICLHLSYILIFFFFFTF